MMLHYIYLYERPSLLKSVRVTDFTVTSENNSRMPEAQKQGNIYLYERTNYWQSVTVTDFTVTTENKCKRMERKLLLLVIDESCKQK